jgi:hypothetical protein
MGHRFNLGVDVALSPLLAESIFANLQANEDVLDCNATAFEILAIEAEGEKVGIAGCLS